jgi:hypothetical protein
MTESLRYFLPYQRDWILDESPPSVSPHFVYRRYPRSADFQSALRVRTHPKPDRKPCVVSRLKAGAPFES